MKKETIVVIASQDAWLQAQAKGSYRQSVIDTPLDAVGFIHCSFPNQTLEIANRRFSERDDLLLLLVDVTKVKAPIKYEGALSGRPGTFPHVYGPLHVDAVYATVELTKNQAGEFVVATSEFSELFDNNIRENV